MVQTHAKSQHWKWISLLIAYNDAKQAVSIASPSFLNLWIVHAKDLYKTFLQFQLA